MLPACHQPSPESGAAPPFREPLQFIVMSVIIVIGVAFPYTYAISL
jgi:hypothetical protein